MALKFRRGTTAQKSGSLAFGEPYVNTTLGTLQIGLDTGDVTLASSNGLISGSSQVSYIGLSNIPSGIISSSTQLDSLFNIDGLISGSSQVTISDTTGYSTFSSSIATSVTTEKGRIDAILAAADADKDTFAEIVTLINSVDTTNDNAFASFYTASVNRLNNVESYTSSFAGASATLTNKTISGASNTLSNIANASLTNSSITIAGTSTSLGGTISAATILGAGSTSNLSEGSNLYYTDARVKTKLNAETVISGSSQISHDSTTGYSANRHIDHTAVSISAGSGLTGGGDISTTRTISIANLGVTDAMLAGSISNAKLTNSSVTVTAGTGLSGGGAVSLGSSVTLTNAGVTSAVAGTGVSVSGATGAVTISIGQSVATNATPTFGNLTINGTITATGDITAYYTSDSRHKNSIEIIPNALDKVKQLNGVTWEWNDDVNEVTKSTPKTGLIAQEVQEVLPQVVTEREDGFLALDYSKMMGLMVEAIKEQQTIISKLESEIKQLSDTIRVFEENKGL